MRARLWLALVAAGCAAQQPDVPVDIAFPAVDADTLVVDSLPPGVRVNGAATFRAPDASSLVAATTSDDALIIVDARTHRIVRRIGTSGIGLNEFRDPAGVAILGDSIALVTERGNARVQGFHLPDLTPVGVFGDRLLSRPVAIAAAPASNAYAVYVTDNPADSAARVVQFRITVKMGELVAIHWRTFAPRAGESSHAREATRRARN